MSHIKAWSSGTAPKITDSTHRDEHFFLESIYFKVEGYIFLVPRRHFETNAIFSTTFTLPPSGKDVEGLSEDNPFELPGILREDFQALLCILYPEKVPFDSSDITIAQWQSVLTLSTMWDFQSIREMSVQKLGVSGVLNSVAKMILGEKHNISDWFISGCEELVLRAKGPRLEEVKELGMEFAVRIYDLREDLVRKQARNYQWSLRENVRKAFQDVLGPVI